MELHDREGDPALDLSFRPAGYFWPLDLVTHLLATVKGAERRKHIQSLIDANRLGLLEDLVARSSLAPEVRRAAGRIHPWFMGGEYLPDQLKGEVEIARVTLASTTQDVVSVRARKGKRRIRYRVVDEYGGETLTERNERTSIRPLTLGQLIDFLDGAWSIREVVTMNEMQCDVEAMRSFVTVSSPFYRHLATHYDRCFEEWAGECEQPEDEEGDDAAAAGGDGAVMRDIAFLSPLNQLVRGFAGGHDHAAASSIGMATFKGESRHAVSVFSAQWTPQALLETASQRLQGAHDEALLGLQGSLRREVDPRPERNADDREENRRLLSVLLSAQGRLLVDEHRGCAQEGGRGAAQVVSGGGVGRGGTTAAAGIGCRPDERL